MAFFHYKSRLAMMIVYLKLLNRQEIEYVRAVVRRLTYYLTETRNVTSLYG